MDNYYEINVAKNGKHFFATAPRSLRSIDQYTKVLKEIQKRFPKSEGFVVTGTRWESRGYPLLMTKDEPTAAQTLIGD